MIKGDPSRLDGRELVIVDSDRSLEIALSKYGVGNQDGFFVMEKNVIIVKKYGDFEEEARRLGYTEGIEFTDVKEALSYYLALIVKLHKKYRLTLAGWESEILSNLDFYIKLRNEMDLDKELPEEMNLFLDRMKEIINTFPDENLSIDGKEKQVFMITQAIIHKYTYDDYGFNSEEELVSMLSSIVLAVLRK